MQDCKFYEARVNPKLGIFETSRIDKNHGHKNKMTGYWSILLKPKGSKGFVTQYMHRAIFEEATGIRIPPGFQIHHRDANPDNNCIDNLCMCTARFNNLEAASRRDYSKVIKSRKENGFTQKVRAISGNHETVYPSLSQCARAVGLSVSRISNIVNGGPYQKAYSKTLKKKFTFVRVRKTNGKAV
jgi:hypothetical protein